MLGIKKKTEIKRLLIMRFSAMGDVAMTVPVIYALASQHPSLRITVLTRTKLAPLFSWLPANVQVKGIDFDENDGIIGLTKLYNSLRDSNFDAVADIHDVLRTKYLRTCFLMNGTRVVSIDKGRDEKKELIGCGQTHKPLKPMMQRYADVFRALGFELDLSKKVSPDLRSEDFKPVYAVSGRKQIGDVWVGVAPFAAHPQKVYPIDKMQKVVEALAAKGFKVFLFGSGQNEVDEMRKWTSENVICTFDKLGGLYNEMLLMSKLDIMISMDSANMHIASIFGTPVLSIWGATHPKAGFSGFGQKEESEMQLDLPCRPCSIYGNKPCQYGDLRCMDMAPEDVVKRLLSLIGK